MNLNNNMLVKWSLWLDDQWDDRETPNRWPPDGFLPARSAKEAIALVTRLGPPSFMDLDHDLGQDNCMDFLKWLADNYFEFIPKYNIHSANPIGKKNIESYMESWRRSLGFK